MSYDEKMSHWTRCVALRMNDIKSIEDSPKQIVDLWPQYKAPDGFRLVRSDIKLDNQIQNNLV